MCVFSLWVLLTLALAGDGGAFAQVIPFRNASAAVPSQAAVPGLEGKTFVFFFSTGRCGTNWLSRTLKQRRETPALVKFEYEHGEKAAVMRKILRPSMASNNTRAVRNYVFNQKIPAMVRELDLAGKRLWVDTGHQVVMGMMEHLIDALGPHIRVVHLRRHRLDTAASFSGDSSKKDPCRYSPHENYMHYCPFDEGAFLKPGKPATWDSLNLFQKYLWWCDEVEARWRWLRATRPSFPYIEVDYHHRLGLQELQRISDFAGVGFDRRMVAKKHVNSHNKRSYPRIWRLLKDEAYRRVMPPGTAFSF